MTCALALVKKKVTVPNTFEMTKMRVLHVGCYVRTLASYYVLLVVRS